VFVNPAVGGDDPSGVAPYRRDQLNWDTVPEWGDMEKAHFDQT
jgi:hypothetical protein